MESYDTKNYMHKPQEGTWILNGPDGRHWKGGNPLACVKAELYERVPEKVRMERLSSFILDEEESEREFEKWWDTSKYTQVIYADKGMKQIAKDAWEAARK